MKLRGRSVMKTFPEVRIIGNSRFDRPQDIFCHNSSFMLMLNKLILCFAGRLLAVPKRTMAYAPVHGHDMFTDTTEGFESCWYVAR
jgi:hypothetical protein